MVFYRAKTDRYAALAVEKNRGIHRYAPDYPVFIYSYRNKLAGCLGNFL
jgi:hypothetical protein